MALKEYLALIEKYLRELIEEYKLKGQWKVQLTIEVNFISLKPGSDETLTRSDNVEIMFDDSNDDMILLNNFLDHYYKNMKKSYRKK